MPQPTAITFWKTNRRLQEESRILREDFKNDFQALRKLIARAKRRWRPLSHQTRSAIAENLQRLSVRQSLEQISYGPDCPRRQFALGHNKNALAFSTIHFRAVRQRLLHSGL